MKHAKHSSRLRPMQPLRLTLAVMALFVSFVLQPSGNLLAADPWPMFQNDAQHTGRSPFVGPQTNNTQCLLPLDGHEAGSPVIAADGTIYLISNRNARGFLFAINPDCTRKWVVALPGPAPFTTPAISADGVIHVHAVKQNLADPYNTVEMMTAILPNGTLKWQFEFNDGMALLIVGVALSSPAIAPGGTVYVESLDTRLYAINPMAR